MAVLRPRSRMVTFRLSDKEYQDLQDLCIAHGARSVSDLARSALHKLRANGSGAADAPLRAMFDNLNGKVQELDQEVKRLAELLEKPSHTVLKKKVGVGELS